MMKNDINHQRGNLLNFSIQNGRIRFQKKNIEDRKIRNAVDEEKRIFDFSNSKKKEPDERIGIDNNLNSHIQKIRKEIVPFQFSETKVTSKSDTSESSHDEYVKSNDNSLVLKQVYQDKLRDNTDDLKKSLNQK
jgi:hypothetical protein